MNGFKWESFVGPFNYYNSSLTPIPFWERQHKIASICRSELIDTENFWHLISIALDTVPDVIFEYTGNEAIHKKWCEKFGLPESRVNFLGWLDAPEKHLRRYKALIDPYPLGHGVIAREAIRAEVPIIFSWNEEAADSPIRKEKLADTNLISLIPDTPHCPLFSRSLRI